MPGHPRNHHTWVFREGRLDEERLSALIKAIGAERLVLDLSCRLRGGRYWVVTDRWQTFTEMPVDETILRQLAPVVPNSSCTQWMWKVNRPALITI